MSGAATAIPRPETLMPLASSPSASRAARVSVATRPDSAAAPAPDGAQGAPAAEDGAEDDAEDGAETFMSDKDSAAETPAAAPEEAEAPAGTLTGGDGGFDALTAAEIGLASALAVLLVGSLALAFAGRRR